MWVCLCECVRGYRFVIVGVESVGEVVGVCACVSACGCGWLGAVVDMGVCTYVVVGVGVEMCECCIVVGVCVCVCVCARARARVGVGVFVNVGGCVQV